ncbi:hypothetical protein SLE2022_293510 [Rubroshorea leprosula]
MADWAPILIGRKSQPLLTRSSRVLITLYPVSISHSAACIYLHSDPAFSSLPTQIFHQPSEIHFFSEKTEVTEVMSADWGPVLVATVLFVLLSPGLLFQIPAKGRVVEFGKMNTSGASILVHAIIYFGLITIFLIAIGVHIHASN